MRIFGVASAAGTLLAGAALFASSVAADLDPIVIKVSGVIILSVRPAQ
jgi:hypothetical protein